MFSCYGLDKRCSPNRFMCRRFGSQLMELLGGGWIINAFTPIWSEWTIGTRKLFRDRYLGTCFWRHIPFLSVPWLSRGQQILSYLILPPRCLASSATPFCHSVQLQHSPKTMAPTDRKMKFLKPHNKINLSYFKLFLSVICYRGGKKGWHRKTGRPRNDLLCIHLTRDGKKWGPPGLGLEAICITVVAILLIFVQVLRLCRRPNLKIMN